MPSKSQPFFIEKMRKPIKKKKTHRPEIFSKRCFLIGLKII